MISHFALAAEVEAFIAAGYSVFCCLDEQGVKNATLPPHVTEEWEMERGLPSYWWKEEVSESDIRSELTSEKKRERGVKEAATLQNVFVLLSRLFVPRETPIFDF